MAMNPLAQELNAAIAGVNPHVANMFSDLGKALYFPKGILSQSAEAKQQAHRFNATIGTALENGTAMNLPSVMASLGDIAPNEALLYAPSQGIPELRQAWLEKVKKDNPDLEDIPLSLPVVTSGLTHGLSLVGDLFVDQDDILLLPDKIWGNYRLIFALRRGADIRQYRFFEDEQFNHKAFEDALNAACAERGKVIVLLNFPNNPTGYTPTEAEGDAIAASLLRAAEGGTNIVAVTDDAYFGLFFDDDAMRQSLFTRIAGRHPRLLAIKADAATKEAYAWGLRVGFLTFAVAGAKTDSSCYSAIEKKAAGCVRSLVSNCSRLSQKVVAEALKNPNFYQQRAAKAAVMRERAQTVKQVLADEKYAAAWTPYPFNSGYFMCLKIRDVNAETLRLHALKTYGIGTISINDTDLRIAFSCLEISQIRELFDLLLQSWKDLIA